MKIVLGVQILLTCVKVVSCALRIWSSIIIPEKLHEFLAMDDKDWIVSNLCKPSSFSTIPDWKLLFGFIYWGPWKFICKRNFEPDLGSKEGHLQWSVR